MIGAVVNTNPAIKRKAPDVARIRNLVGALGSVWTTSSLSELDEVATRVAAAEPEIVVVWGGDGTISATLSALRRAYGGARLPKFQFVRAGTINTISTCLGIRGRPMATLERLTQATREGRHVAVERRTSLRVGDRLGFLFGIGLVPNLLAVYNDASTGGAWTALGVFAKAAKSLARAGYDEFFSPFEGRISSAGQTWCEGPFTNISAGGIDCLPFGLEPYTRACEIEGHYHLIAHHLDARGALNEIVRIRSGRGMKNVEQNVFAAVHIELGSPMPFNLDGDNLEPQRSFDLVAGPIIRALVPR